VLDTTGFRGRWTLAFTVGELVGFVPPALVGAWLGFSGAPPWALVVGLTLAGSLEGASIGSAQAVVLRRHQAPIRTRSWVIGTAVGAAIAWFAGMGGAAAMEVFEGAAVLVLLVPVWIAGLMAMGFLQWLAMRAEVPRSARWVPVSSGAWLVGVLIPVAAISLAPDTWPTAAHVVVAVASAVVMGLVVGWLTGGTMRRLLSGSEAGRI
jgi:hypothetical protein